MKLPQHLIDRFGGNVPQYVRDWWQSRLDAEQRRADAAAAAEEAAEAEFQRKRSLRRAPERVWLEAIGSHGMEVHWEPPETADELPPTGYIVWGDSDSSQLLPPEQRSQFLRIYQPGNEISVNTDYSEYQITQLGEHHSRRAEPEPYRPAIKELACIFRLSRSRWWAKAYPRSLLVHRRYGAPVVARRRRDGSAEIRVYGAPEIAGRWLINGQPVTLAPSRFKRCYAGSADWAMLTT